MNFYRKWFCKAKKGLISCVYTRPIQIKCFWDLIWLYSNLSTKAAKECCNSNWWSWLIIIQLTMLEIDAYASMNIFNKFWRLLNNKQFVDSGERCNRDEFLKNKIKMILEKMFILLETKNIFLKIIYKKMFVELFSVRFGNIRFLSIFENIHASWKTEQMFKKNSKPRDCFTSECINRHGKTF